jgi:hypothetical protein
VRWVRVDHPALDTLEANGFELPAHDFVTAMPAVI